MRVITFLTIVLCLSHPFSVIHFSVTHAALPDRITVGIYDFKPLILMDADGRPQGIFPDILTDFADQRDISLEFVHGTWDQCLEWLKTGRIDLLPAIVRTEERTAVYSFSKETVLASWGQVYTREGLKAGNMLDLEGKRIAGQTGDYYADRLRRLLNAFNVSSEFIMVNQSSDIFRLLQENKADAGVVDRLNGLENAYRFPVNRSPIIFEPKPILFATPRDRHLDLLLAIDIHLLNEKQEKGSSYYQAVEKWMGRETDPAIPRWVLWMSLGMAGALAFSLLFTLLLRARVRKGTAQLSRRAAELEKEINERQKAEASLRSIQWLLTQSVPAGPHLSQPYGDLADLNKDGTIINNVGREMLTDIVNGFLELLDTSSAVYERNGDYATSIFSSGWCRMMDAASRNMCPTPDNQEAMDSGKWLCHESCWADASKRCMETGGPVDIPCRGGLRLYAIPIRANGEIIGAINFGYGSPPRAPGEIHRIANEYGLDPADLIRESGQCESRPQFIVDVAKKRLQGAAKLIGALVETRLARSELHRERERLNVTLQSIGDGVITTDIFGKVVLINRVGETLTGWQQYEARGRHLDTVFKVVDGQSGDTLAASTLNGNKMLPPQGTLRLAGRDGTERIVASSVSPIVGHDGDAMGIVLVFRDVTEKLEMETELRHAHKMEAIGNLAGGIAHEFNNVLSIIIGNTELSIDDLEQQQPQHPVSDKLKEVTRASLRARDVVKQLLSFSRKIDIRQEPVDLSHIIEESLKLLRASIPSFIRIREAFPPEVNTVVADAIQIHQLLINLCNNASQAMDRDGGDLTITLENMDLDTGAASRHPDLSPGPYVRLGVSDTGHGIPADITDRIFDPYFTTKPVGKGTGMGLAVVHGIVKSHNAAIIVNSSPGKGSTFYVYFPASGEPAAPDTNQPQAPTHTEGAGRLLFVDDEPAIVKYGTTLLDRMGYQVTSDTDPIRILERFRMDPDAYDLVISDMTMPGMTGERLAGEMMEIRPDIPIIICTGFSEKISPDAAKKMKIKGLLSKPVDKDTLGTAIRDILGT
ncbi:MAG: transporter substrate-binding domain-containing protein [Desulfobacter sp.]